MIAQDDPPRRARPHPKPAPRRPAGAAGEEAQALAIRALGFLAADPERLERFMALSGLTPDTLRAAAAEPGFLSQVLETLCADEPALLAFAAEDGLDPAAVEAARQRLAGPAPE